MTRWLVSNVPSWLLFVAVVLVVAGGAVLIQVFIRHRFPRLRADEHNEVMRFAFGVIGMVYAFFVGFIVHALWGQLSDAGADTRAEGAAGVQLVRYLSAFDQADQDRIHQHLLDYESAAIAEWPLAAEGRVLPEAETALGRLYAAYEGIAPRDDTQKAFLSSSMDSLNHISTARTERLIQATTDVGPSWSLWAVILLTSALVLGGAIAYSVEAPARHYTMVATVGVLVAANLFLIMELAHPFLGEVATSSKPLDVVVQFLDRPPQ